MARRYREIHFQGAQVLQRSDAVTGLDVVPELGANDAEGAREGRDDALVVQARLGLGELRGGGIQVGAGEMKA